MAQVDDQQTTASIPGSGRTSGIWVWGLRMLWILLAGVMYGFTISGAPARYRELITDLTPFSGRLANILWGITPEFAAGYLVGIGGFMLVLFALPAIVLYWARQDDWVALIASMTLIGLSTASTDYADALLSLRGGAYAIPIDLIRSTSLYLPLVFLFVFPNGKSEPSFTRWIAMLAVVWTVIRPFLYGTPGHPDQWSSGLFAAVHAPLLIVALFSQGYRYVRKSSPEERQQTKWIVYGSVLTILSFITLLLIQVAFPAVAEVGTLEWLSWRPIEYTLYIITLLPLPLVFTISVLRFRLWDIDFLINRSAVYGTLLAALVGMFGVSLLAIQRLATSLAGGSQGAIAVIVVAMVAAVMFQPAQKQLQRFVDTRFYDINIRYSGRDHMLRAADIAGTRFADYTDMYPIGRGGMAVVYLAHHPSHPGPLALKVLSPAIADKPGSHERFVQEAEIVQSLDHPNIVNVVDYGESDDTKFMVMEYINGPTVSGMLDEGGPVPLDQAIPLITQLADALDYAHQRGLVHRDIKPSNVMVDLTGEKPRAVLMDFGIARMVAGESNLTATGLVGTFDYMSPEQIRGDVRPDPRSDIYAFGVMTYQMLTGKLPFPANNAGAVLIAHMQQPAPDARDLRPDLPEDVSEAIQRAMAKLPENRFQTAGEFAQALAEAVQES